MAENFEHRGVFLCRDGKGRHQAQEYSHKKLCFAATDKEFLMQLLFELSQDEKCYFVKLSDKDRDGMYLGRCFFIDDETVARHWAKYKAHPKLFCNVQDDDFVKSYRDQVERHS